MIRVDLRLIKRYGFLAKKVGGVDYIIRIELLKA